MALIVQKYCGTSVGSVELINRVAARVAAVRERSDQIAVVVSAMGDSTGRLVDLAKQISSEPDVRELDVLLTTGEQGCARSAGRRHRADRGGISGCRRYRR